jgi:hypothetical protein
MIALIFAEAPTHWGLTAAEWITIAAIVVGPILAVVTQLVWQRTISKRDQKLNVFGTMMSLRGTPLHPDFIKVANFIDVLYYKNQVVRRKWGDVLAHLSSDAYKPENFNAQAFERFKDLLSELLNEMARDLGYEYDHLDFKERAWTPLWHVAADEEWAALRKGFVQALNHQSSLAITAYPLPAVPPPPPAAPNPNVP